MSVSGDSGPDPASGDGLQFDRAEFSGGHTGPVCSNCQQPASPEYHEFAGRVFCTKCREEIEASVKALKRSGSFLRAFGFGLAAAIAGSLLFYAVSALTGYEFGLIAVVVGFMVGKAVSVGSGSLGGRRYQAIAMILTYLSIVSTYVPGMARYAEDSFAKAQKEQAEARQKSGQAPIPDQPAPRLTPVTYVFLFGLATVAPFLGGFSNILGVIIIGIGLWEAWKLTRRVNVVFTGPFSTSPAGQAAGA